MDAKSSAQRIQELRRKGKALLEAKSGSELSEEDRKVLTEYKTEIDRITDELAQAKIDADAPLMAIINGTTPTDPAAEDGAKLSRTAVKKFTSRLALKAGGLGHRVYKSEAEPGDLGSAFGVKAAVALTNVTDTIVQDVAVDPQIPLGLLDVIPVKAIDSPTFRFGRQSVRDLKAAPVARGGTKPTSTIGITGVDARLEVIATVSDQIHTYDLVDVDMLEQFVESEFRYGIMSALEDQILNGTGTSPQLSGILTTSGIQTAAAGADIAATVRSSITKLESLGYAPSAIVMSPASWETVETTQTSGSGEYVFASSPVDRAARKLWGVSVVTSLSLPANTAVVLSQGAVQLYSDNAVKLDWSTTGDDFVENAVRARMEGRFQTAVLRPQGIVKATLPTPTP